MTAVKSALRERFEIERRRSSFLSALPGIGVGIIVTDTWISHWFGAIGGLVGGGVAYAAVYAYETVMWRREHG